MLGIHHDVVKRRHKLHHERNLLAVIRKRHVLPQTRTEVLGLAYIDDVARCIFPQIASRSRRNALDLLCNGKRPVFALGAHMGTRRAFITCCRTHAGCRLETRWTIEAIMRASGSLSAAATPNVTIRDTHPPSATQISIRSVVEAMNENAPVTSCIVP